MSLTNAPAPVTTATSATFDFFTSDTNPPPGGIVTEVSLDNSPFRIASGPVTYPTLSQGQHTFQVEAIDSVGNISAIKSYQWTVTTLDWLGFPVSSQTTVRRRSRAEPDPGSCARGSPAVT